MPMGGRLEELPSPQAASLHQQKSYLAGNVDDQHARVSSEMREESSAVARGEGIEIQCAATTSHGCEYELHGY